MRSVPPPGGSGPTRESTGSSCARPTRTWPSPVVDDRVVLWDRRRDLVYDDAGVREKWGVAPTSIPDWLGLVGDSSDGFPGIPGWGAKSAAAVLLRYGHYEEIPPKASAWEVPGIGGSRAMTLAASLRDHLDEAFLYRDLARLRSVADGVPIRQTDPDELRWDGAPSARMGGVLRGMGPRPAAVTAASLAGRRLTARAPGLPAQRARSSSVPWWPGGRGHDPDRLRGVAEVEPRAAGHRGDRGPAPLGDQAGGRHVPGGQPALLDEGIEPAVGDVGQGERRRAHRARDADGLADVAATGRRGPAVEGHADDEVGELLLGRGTDRAIGKERRPVRGGREGLATGRVHDDPDRRDAIDHERDRDAEDGQAVGVVDRAVEWIDDPDPATPRGGRLARDGTVLPGLLGKDRVVRVPGADGVQDERLGQGVRLGHDVPCALVVHALEPLVAVHQHGPGALRDLEREGQLRGHDRGGRHDRSGHGALHSTVN